MNINIKSKIEESAKKIGMISLDLDKNIEDIKKKANEYSRKDINFNFIDRFTQFLYINPYHLAKLEFIQYIIFVALLFYYNPLDITTKYPAFTRLLTLVVAFIYIMLFLFVKIKVENTSDIDLIDPTETNVLTQFISTILFFILFMALIKCIIWVLINTSVMNAVRHMMSGFIIVGVLGIIYLFMRKTINKAKNAPGRKFITLLIKIIMYLPCLLVDTVEYVKYQYNLTTKPIWILLCVEAGFIGLWFILPLMFDKIMTRNGLRLLNKPLYLNNENTLGDFKQLHEKRNLIADSDLTNIDQMYSNKINNEAQQDIDNTVNSLESTLKPVYTDPNIPKNKYLAIIYNKMQHIPWLKVKLNIHPQYTDANTKRFRYKYALSGWFNINPQPPNTRTAYTVYTNILKYGDKVKIEYNGTLGSLRVMCAVASKKTDETIKNDLFEVYETKKVLYQKWNNIVINYDDGFLDVFLNGDLVGSISGVAPYMTFDSIVAGSNKGILGGICNVTYYEAPLKKSDIVLTYKAMRDKKLPYIWSITDDININIKKSKPNKNIINNVKHMFGVE